MVQFWFSQNWSKLGQSGQHQVNCSVSGFGLSWFGSTVVWVKIRVRSTVLGPSQPGQTWSTRLTRSTRSTQLAYPTNRREGFVDMRIRWSVRSIVVSVVVKMRGRPFLHFQFPPQQEMVVVSSR
uniref:Uncharacterized protein n=1 Tax=Helianthus annuus TaxID=4232 RepID=A0A251SH18_HELAN